MKAFRPYGHKAMTDALLNLRAQIIRDELPGLEHVEALLALRGHELERVPKKIGRTFGRNGLRRIVMDALRDGPQPPLRLVEAVKPHRPDWTHDYAYRATYSALRTMRMAGQVKLEDGLWRIITVLDWSC
jgi:hypothetical protein